MTGPPTRSQVSSLEDKLDLAIEEMRELAPIVRRSNNRSKTGLQIAVVGVIVGAIGIASGIAARDAVNAANRARDEAREASCKQNNVLIAATRLAITDSILVLATDPNNLTAPEQVLYDAYSARVAAGLPYRDCSPAGIAAYFENPPADPAATTTEEP